MTGPSSSVSVSDSRCWSWTTFFGIICFLGLLRVSELSLVLCLDLDLLFLESFFVELLLDFELDFEGSFGFKRSTFKSPRFEIGVELDAFFFDIFSFDLDLPAVFFIPAGFVLSFLASFFLSDSFFDRLESSSEESLPELLVIRVIFNLELGFVILRVLHVFGFLHVFFTFAVGLLAVWFFKLAFLGVCRNYSNGIRNLG